MLSDKEKWELLLSTFDWRTELMCMAMGIGAQHLSVEPVQVVITDPRRLLPPKRES